MEETGDEDRGFKLVSDPQTPTFHHGALQEDSEQSLCRALAAEASGHGGESCPEGGYSRRPWEGLVVLGRTWKQQTWAERRRQGQGVGRKGHIEERVFFPCLGRYQKKNI